MDAGRKRRSKVILALAVTAILAFPLTGLAHSRVHVGIGFGWWEPAWAHPYPYHYPYYYDYYDYGPVFHVPVRVEPLPPRCRKVWVDGGWERVGQEDDGGFTTFREHWVPGHWERVCP